MIAETLQIVQQQKKISCTLLGHQLKVVKNYQQGQKEYTCKWCKSQFTDNGLGKIDKLTPKLHHLNEALEEIYKRQRRLGMN